MMFILCSVRIPTSYGLPLAMIDVWKYILSSENNFRRQLLLDFVVHRPEIFKTPASMPRRFIIGFPLFSVRGPALGSRPAKLPERQNFGTTKFRIPERQNQSKVVPGPMGAQGGP